MSEVRQFLASVVKSVACHVAKEKAILKRNVNGASSMVTLKLRISWLVDFCSSMDFCTVALLCREVLTAE